jgi:hypothetical protein
MTRAEQVERECARIVAAALEAYTASPYTVHQQYGRHYIKINVDGHILTIFIEVDGTPKK